MINNSWSPSLAFNKILYYEVFNGIEYGQKIKSTSAGPGLMHPSHR
jgi:hypothetical protein